MIKLALLVGMLVVVLAISAGTVNAGGHQPTAPFGTVAVQTGEGHAPNEPAASVRGHLRSFRQFLQSRRLAAATKACVQHGAYQIYNFKDMYGVLLFSYFEQVYYCRDGVNVTYFYRYRGHHESSIVPFVHYSPWEFNGHQSSGNDCSNEHCFIRGFKAPQRTAVTEGKFQTCLIPGINIGCNYVYPVIHITVYGDGSKPDSGWSD